MAKLEYQGKFDSLVGDSPTKEGNGAVLNDKERAGLKLWALGFEPWPLDFLFNPLDCYELRSK